MRVAVTGATGFVGRHVVAHLAAQGVPVVIVARPASVIPGGLEKHRCVRLDLHDAPGDVFQMMGSPDVLIHLAWGGLPNYGSPHHLDDELPAQFRFLSAAMTGGGGPRHLVVSGTCGEYGLQYGPLSEAHDPRPNTPYAQAKDTLRRRLGVLRESQPFALTWGRLFYLYGDGQGRTSLASQLAAAVARGDAEFPMSHGEQLRDYLPVDVAARHIAQLALGRHDNGIVNICSGTPISVRRLVEQWIETNGWTIRLRLGALDYPAHEPLAFWGDRSKLDACLAQR